MKEFNWKIIFTFQILLIIGVSSILSYKMGVFEEIKQQIVHDAIAEEPYIDEDQDISLQKTEQVKKVEVKKDVVKEKTADKKDEDKTKQPENTKEETVKEASISEDNTPTVFSRKTDAEVKKVVEKYKDKIADSYIATVTSYNSESGQTDDSPCIAASGVDVCKRNVEDIVATNDLPFHTKILIPEYFGDQIFYVEDRMNARYTGTDRLDIWMKNKTDSKNFGAKVLKIIVLK
ncbi:MAG: hypothetical protein QMB51_00040 [Patescibacteria group bacterium]